VIKNDISGFGDKKDLNIYWRIEVGYR